MKVKLDFKLLFILQMRLCETPSNTAKFSRVLLEEHDSRGDSAVFNEI